MSLKIGIHPSSVTPPDPATTGTTGASRSSPRFETLRRGAQTATGGLVDFGSQTGLMMRLAAAAEGKGPDWQALREEVLSNLPREPGSLRLSFKKAFEQAEASAGPPGSPTYTSAYASALMQLKTAFTMARILQLS